MLSPSPPNSPPSTSQKDDDDDNTPPVAEFGGENEQAPSTLTTTPTTSHPEESQPTMTTAASQLPLVLTTCLSANSESASHIRNNINASGGPEHKSIFLTRSQQINSTSSQNQNEVFITQPHSLPASPIPSPAPGQRQTPTPTPSINWVSENLVVVQNRANNCSPTNYISSSHASCSASASRANDTSTQDWQALKTGVRERNAAMCNNDLMADVTFVVSSSSSSPVTFPAHKYVLATGSSVFFAMFYGTLAEQGSQVVVPDVEPDAFLKMLKYLYADEIDLDEESVLPTLHVAKKYIIPHLAKSCVQYMEASLTARNACVLLCQSRIFDEPDLMQRCWEVIDAQAEMALNSEGFIDIDHSTLKEILSRETLNCKEFHVFEAAMAWATADCERQELQPTPDNLRIVLGGALQLIRVPTMDLVEFADGPAQVGIFSLQECHDMFLHFTASLKPKLAYPIVPRAGLKPQVCHRFQSSAYRSNQWRYRGRCDSIQFQVDRRIFIVGFGLYGSSTGATTYGVHIELKRQGRILAENNTEFFSDGSSNTFHVYFQQPVQIDPDIFYTASAILDGMELSYFGQEGMTDVAVSNVAFQFQCSSESTNGTGVQGGQIPELIFYGPTPTLSSSQNSPQFSQENNSGSSFAGIQGSSHSQ